MNVDESRSGHTRSQRVVGMTTPKEKPVDWEALLKGIFRGKTVIECGRDRDVFRQGQPADSLFYLRRGKVKLTVISPEGKEAIIAILDAGEFFGEGCLASQPLHGNGCCDDRLHP